MGQRRDPLATMPKHLHFLWTDLDNIISPSYRDCGGDAQGKKTGFLNLQCNEAGFPYSKEIKIPQPQRKKDRHFYKLGEEKRKQMMLKIKERLDALVGV